MSTLFDLPFEDPEPEPPDPEAPAAPAARQVLSVSDLTVRIRRLLEDRFVDVWVDGELSNCKVWHTGHMYFSLKDAGAQIRGVMFRTAVRQLRFAPQDGLRVIARGRITVYDPKGDYQIVCDRLEPEGLGARQLAFDQLKRRLDSEGLFDPSRKRPLPLLPRKIGVVTSLDGAAIRDIVQVLRRRYANAHIVIRPARVQGEGAALEIARALAAIGRHPGVDVVIVGRGGGSIEDLWAFNEESVARAIAGCPVPTIAAVGHETDVTIADFVADLRAPTPSAAAELVVARKDEVCTRIDTLARRAAAAMRARRGRLENRLRSLEARPGFAGAPARLALRGRHVAELTGGLRRALQSGLATRLRRVHALRLQLESFDLRRRLGGIRTRLVTIDARLAAAITSHRHQCDRRLRAAAARLGSLSPLAVLARGYAVCWTEDRTTIVRHAAHLTRGDRVRVTLEHGELACEVHETHPDGAGEAPSR